MTTRLLYLLLLGCFVLLGKVGADDNLNNPDLTCYECNVVQRTSVKQQRLKPCAGNTTLRVRNCAACAKYVTYMNYDFRKPRFGQEYMTNMVVSKFCLQNVAPRWPNQCVSNYGSGSVQIRCFCDSSFCNKALSYRRLEMSISLVGLILAYLAGRII